MQTALYSAAAQAVSLDRENFSDAVVGSITCLLFGAAIVIVSFDWENQTFAWLEKAKCLSKLGMTEDQFIDFSLISGFTNHHTACRARKCTQLHPGRTRDCWSIG